MNATALELGQSALSMQAVTYSEVGWKAVERTRAMQSKPGRISRRACRVEGIHFAIRVQRPVRISRVRETFFSLTRLLLHRRSDVWMRPSDNHANQIDGERL